jgi:hypothetical protein
MMQERELRALLANIFEHLKEQQLAIASVMDQLASLRDVLKEASPEFARVFSERLKHWQSQTAALNAGSAKLFDETIRQLKEY